MLKQLLNWFLFAFTMFAAGAPAVGDAGGGADGAIVDTGAGDGTGAEDISSEGAETVDTTSGEGESVSATTEENLQTQERPEDKDTADFKGLVSKRLVQLKKDAPELASVFQKYPKVQEQIEAAFRRDMAYRELYPTLAEARQIRERFPNGLADVQELEGELESVEALDNNFYTRDERGEYPGHRTLIENLFSDDRAAAVALFRQLPKEWARLDRESYNDVFGGIVGVTLANIRADEYLQEISELAKDNPQIKKLSDRLLAVVNGFLQEKPAPSAEERRLEEERQRFQREKDQRQQQDFSRFKNTFFAESDKLQRAIILKHAAIQELFKSKAIPETKKNEIVKKVQTKIREQLRNSRAFMSKLNPAYRSGDLQKSLDIQKVQWSYPWVLNKFVRQVMAEETPNLVRQNQQRTRPAASATQRPAAQRGQVQTREQHTEPYKENGQWYSKEGRRLTTSEILRGGVPDHLLHAK
jgi:hypothetical protein